MESEDKITGTAGKTTFSFSEVHAEYKTETSTKNGTRTEWHDIFKGIIFCAGFNKPFQGTTFVRPKDTASALTAWLAKNAPILCSHSSEFVQLENPEFTKEFVTWSGSQTEARYILTPAMMERLCKLNSRSPATISISFTGSTMYLAFPLDKNYFEPPIFKTLLNNDLLKDDLEIVRFMYGIVNDLDLNTRLWTAQ